MISMHCYEICIFKEKYVFILYFVFLIKAGKGLIDLLLAGVWYGYGYGQQRFACRLLYVRGVLVQCLSNATG